MASSFRPQFALLAIVFSGSLVTEVSPEVLQTLTTWATNAPLPKRP